MSRVRQGGTGCQSGCGKNIKGIFGIPGISGEDMKILIEAQARLDAKRAERERLKRLLGKKGRRR